MVRVSHRGLCSKSNPARHDEEKHIYLNKLCGQECKWLARVWNVAVIILTFHCRRFQDAEELAQVGVNTFHPAGSSEQTLPVLPARRTGGGGIGGEKLEADPMG